MFRTERPPLKPNAARAAARQRERALEALRQTLLRDPRCWLLLAAGLALSLWAWSGAAGFQASLPVMSLILALQAWLWLGHTLAAPRLAQAMAESDARCQAVEGFPQACATTTLSGPRRSQPE
jgi:hypothetical protein